MWEARAADGRTDALLAHVLARVGPSAQVYRNATHVVVIDPNGRGLGDVPADLLARPPHAWTFEPVR